MRLEVDADIVQLRLALASLPVTITSKRKKVFVEFDNTVLDKEHIFRIVKNLHAVYKTNLSIGTVLERLAGYSVGIKEVAGQVCIYYKDLTKEQIQEALDKDTKTKSTEITLENVVANSLSQLSGQEWNPSVYEPLLMLFALENNLLDPQTMRFNKFE